MNRQGNCDEGVQVKLETGPLPPLISECAHRRGLKIIHFLARLTAPLVREIWTAGVGPKIIHETQLS
jgi:hypothetical protein